MFVILIHGISIEEEALVVFLRHECLKYKVKLRVLKNINLIEDQIIYWNNELIYYLISILRCMQREDDDQRACRISIILSR